jgi:capsular exopolysaccharide synthesis family protein
MANLIRRDPVAVAENQAPRRENIWIDDYLDEKQTEIRRYLEIALKRKWLVLGVAAAVAGAVGLWTYTTPRSYSASVNIQIDPEQNVLPYKEAYAAVVPDPRYLGTQAQVLKSEVLARRAVERLKLTSDPSKVDGTARWFAGNVVVAPVEGTQVVKVTYQAEDPEFAATAVNILADEYVRFGLETKRSSIGEARDFLQEELTKLQQKLQQSEQRLVDYGRAHNILAAAQDNNVIVRKVTELNDQVTKVEAEVLANQYEALESTPLESFPEKLKTAVMKDLDGRQSELEQKLAAATLRFGPKWPEVLALNQQLEDVRKQLVEEKRKALRQAKVEYDLAVMHRDKLAAALEDQNRLADQQAQDSIQYNLLKREAETDRQMHDGLLQRLKETDVSAGLKAGNVHVIDRGHVPTRPSSPNVPLNLALGMMLGLMGGLAVASAVEMLDRTIKTPEDVERDLRLPFLGAIPAFEKSWKQANGGYLAAVGQVGFDPPAGTDIASSVYLESYRALRTSLLFSPEARPHSILVTSSLAGEGKTTTAVNLAVTLAQTGARTIILELDLRRPKLADCLGLDPIRGISRYLSGQSPFHTEIQQSRLAGLFVVTAGPVPPNPPELIGSGRMARLLELLQRHFDYVVIDAPPLTPVTDALVIASQVSGVVLVVNGSTPREKAQKARNLLDGVEARVMGVLVNSVKFDAVGDYYSGYLSHVRPSSTPASHS